MLHPLSSCAEVFILFLFGKKIKFTVPEPQLWEIFTLKHQILIYKLLIQLWNSTVASQTFALGLQNFALGNSQKYLSIAKTTQL